MNTKFNKWFEQTAADPVLRHDAIADFSQRRNILFCCAVVITACAAITSFTPTHSQSTPAALDFAAAMSWISIGRICSNLRMLKMMDKFYKDRGEKVTI